MVNLILMHIIKVEYYENSLNFVDKLLDYIKSNF